MRYEKSETVLRIALDMQGSALGLSLEDIQRRYSDRALSRRTAERLRDAVERLFPQIERANSGELPKRWRLPGGAVGGLAFVTADELADLTTAISVLRRENMRGQVRSMERIQSKIQALLKQPAKARIEPDLEALTEAEGLAMRPGPRPAINLSILSQLREAIITRRKVRLHYTYRGSRKRGYQIVQPYGFLYGTRHYLVAWSEVDRARDFRKFALSNIERVELLAQTFSRKRGFSIQQYAEGSFGVFHEEPVDVVWKFSAKVACRCGGVSVSSQPGPGTSARRIADRSVSRRRPPGNVLAPVHLGRRGRDRQAKTAGLAPRASNARPNCAAAPTTGGGGARAQGRCRPARGRPGRTKRTSRTTAAKATAPATANLRKKTTIGSANERILGLSLVGEGRRPRSNARQIRTCAAQSFHQIRISASPSDA